jgi:hypothetical protein
MPDAGTIGDITGIFFGALEEADPTAAVSAVLEIFSGESAPGTLIEPGMFMVAYSSKRRTSRILILAPRAISPATSSAAKEGVCRRDSTSSPKALA